MLHGAFPCARLNASSVLRALLMFFFCLLPISMYTRIQDILPREASLSLLLSQRFPCKYSKAFFKDIWFSLCCDLLQTVGSLLVPASLSRIYTASYGNISSSQRKKTLSLVFLCCCSLALGIIVFFPSFLVRWFISTTNERSPLLPSGVGAKSTAVPRTASGSHRISCQLFYFLHTGGLLKFIQNKGRLYYRPFGNMPYPTLPRTWLVIRSWKLRIVMGPSVRRSCVTSQEVS